MDAEGNIIPDTYIPQFVTGAADQGNNWVNEIVLEADEELFEGTFQESFNEKTTEDLTDWTIDVNSAVENGKLNLGSTAVNNSISAYNQYISVDVKASDLANGFEIRARISGNNYYSFNVTNSAIKLTKTGEAIATDSFTFDSDKLYRVSLSVVENVLTAYIHDYTDGGALKTLTYTDANVYKGTKFGFATENSGVKLDNVYFSTEEFKANDNGWVANDINGDRDFDIRDLVYTDENKSTTEDNIIARADKNSDKLVTDFDIRKICKFILGLFD